MPIASTRVACRTSTGDQDIAISGIGTPKGAIFELVYATADGSAADHAGYSIGFANGSGAGIQNGVYWLDRHAQASIDTYGGLISNAIISVRNTTDGTEVGNADFVQWITDGVRITWNTAPGSAYLLTVTFLYGNDIANVQTGTFTGSSTLDGYVDISTNFTAANGIFGALRATYGYSVGMFDYNGSSIVQRSIGHYVRDGRVSTEAAGYFSEAYTALGWGTGALFCAFEVTAVSSTYVRVTSRLAGAASGIPYIIWNYADGAEHKVYTFNTPTSTGNSTDTNPNFAPDHVTYFQSLLESVNTGTTADTTAFAGTFGTSHITSSAQYDNSISSEDAALDSNTQSLSDNQAVNLPLHTGAAGLAGTFTSFQATGPQINWSDIESAAKKWIGFAYKAPTAGHNLTAQDITTSAAVLDAPTIGQTHVLSANGITTPAAVLDTSNIGQSHLLSANDITTSPAILDAPTLTSIDTDELTAEDIVTEPVILGQPTIDQTHILSSEEILTEPAVLDQASIGQRHVLSSEEILTEPAVLDQATIGQIHVLSSEEILTEVVILGQPTIAQTNVLSSEEILTEPAILGTPTIAQTHVLSSEEILTEPAVLGQPSMSQGDILSSEDIVTEPAILGTPSIGQTHSLLSEEILTESPILGAPLITSGQIHELSSEDIISEPAVLGQPSIGQTHSLLSEEILTESPILGQSSIGQTHVLSSEEILTDPAILGTSTIGQTHILFSQDITTLEAILGAPSLTEISPDELFGEDILTEPPILGIPSITQIHALSSTNIETLAVEFGSPLIGVIHALSAQDILTDPTIFESSVLNQTHILLNEDIETGIPILGIPILVVRVTPTPEDRIYVISFENRVIPIEEEIREINIPLEIRKVIIE